MSALAEHKCCTSSIQPVTDFTHFASHRRFGFGRLLHESRGLVQSDHVFQRACEFANQRPPEQITIKWQRYF